MVSKIKQKKSRLKEVNTYLDLQLNFLFYFTFFFRKKKNLIMRPGHLALKDTENMKYSTRRLTTKNVLILILPRKTTSILFF